MGLCVMVLLAQSIIYPEKKVCIDVSADKRTDLGKRKNSQHGKTDTLHDCNTCMQINPSYQKLYSSSLLLRDSGHIHTIGLSSQNLSHSHFLFQKSFMTKTFWIAFTDRWLKLWKQISLQVCRLKKKLRTYTGWGYKLMVQEQMTSGL